MGRRPDLVSRIVFLALSTALVFVVTRLVAVPISVFNGQEFDAGDIMIFIFAWTFGPAIGGFAGGVGSFLSDASLPSPFAPFTLVVKGCEGFLAGYIARKQSPMSMSLSWILASCAMVGGYFLTNWIGLGFGLIAGLYEVPFDIVQVVIGGLIGWPVSGQLRRTFLANFLLARTATPKDQG